MEIGTILRGKRSGSDWSQMIRLRRGGPWKHPRTGHYRSQTPGVQAIHRCNGEYLVLVNLINRQAAEKVKPRSRPRRSKRPTKWGVWVGSKKKSCRFAPYEASRHHYVVLHGFSLWFCRVACSEGISPNKSIVLTCLAIRHDKVKS